MAESSVALKRLLSVLLANERIGPHLRLAARRALGSGSHIRMVRVGRVIAGELLRQGELIRTAVQSGDGGPYVLQRGSTRLIDLAPLHLRGIAAGPQRFGSATQQRAATDGPRTRATTASARVSDWEEMLDAMETAQNLDVGDPESGNKGVILDGILSLLERLLPQLRLFVFLHGEDMATAGHRHLVIAGSETRAAIPPWLGQRAPGSAVWTASWRELPQEIREALAAGKQSSAATERDTYHTIAVPLYEPDWQRGGDATESRETGLLFVVGDRTWGRGPLLRLAQRLARFVTRRWRHQKEVNQRIHTDSLTGVPNRAFFDSQFPLELERAKRRESPLTLVLGDLDRFKRINDSCGHQTGDLILQLVARRLQDELRRIDHVCRIGGEEFALILPHTSEAAARDVMTRLLQREIATRVDIAGSRRRVAVTVSYGAVTYPAAGVDAFELYRKADELLYAAKAAGRNRCFFWSSEGEPIVIAGHADTH